MYDYLRRRMRTGVASYTYPYWDVLGSKTVTIVGFTIGSIMLFTLYLAHRFALVNTELWTVNVLGTRRE